MCAKLKDDALPDEAFISSRMEAVQSFAAAEKFARVRGFMQTLYATPPKVILLEGATAEERFQAAQYWALLLDCPNSEKALSPCFSCQVCRRLATHMHRDYFFLDGLESSIKIDTLRNELMPNLGEPPREARYRIVVFREAQSMSTAAANIMLKSLEEPVSATSFLLLTPQRERLLPTLVSRSLVITLPWPESAEIIDGTMLSWEAEICTFIETGRGLLSKTAQRGAIDQGLAQRLIHLCKHNLALSLSGQAPQEGLATVFNRMPKSRQRMIDEILAVAQDHLIYNVNPSLVLEWIFTRFFFLLPRK